MRLRVPLRALRLANPLVIVVLRSPVHRVLSGRLLVLSYRGHRSRRTFRIPLRYAETADGAFVAVAVHPDRKLWWRSFRSGRDGTLVLRGRPIDAHGTLLAGRPRDAALDAYVARYPRSAPLVRDAAIVVFELR